MTGQRDYRDEGEERQLRCLGMGSGECAFCEPLHWNTMGRDAMPHAATRRRSGITIGTHLETWGMWCR